ncbi:linear amide C-N hydrolase [Vibrio crassostreae]|uniref:linear amide C-N hydrolase n=1 Tax=Vibrio crassostreae TaxID=246167 RepID=UPI00104F8FE4|nr:choloylglycine hydrolase family protein [Vibrio crassostreae]TCN91553.1 choloylglycine hydrolase [Vibrio crassostreae]CAK2016933.1 choloylglycine hydrolase [Vibrio crassostreae]CAK2022815.1 choloylglycine hydrolase [Vibrio crassostreae]CAK2058042.1 choloylglycine hydrolase [Vibrio crassostreae]CAK2066048.1 choloylglycine hydrolase [Vibrio crassostreae]
MKLKKLLTTTLIASAVVSATASACTSFILNADDGAVVYGRTMEWAPFDLQSRIAVVPQGQAYTDHMPDGKKGMSHTTKYGFVSMDAVNEDYATDGMNEKGLVVGVLYHPGFAEYAEYNPLDAGTTLSSQALAAYILGQFSTVEEVKEGLKDVKIINRNEPGFGDNPLPLHWTIVDANNDRIVVEYRDGKFKSFENPIGVMTNSPNFDWHMTNLSNYMELQGTDRKPMNINGVEIKPIGGGTGLTGVPGDYTPPSRFIRAVALTQTKRDTVDGADTVEEAFRILDSFQLPVGAAEGGAVSPDYLKVSKSATAWTVSADATNLKYYYHTQFNRQIRMIDLNHIDFTDSKAGIRYMPMDEKREQKIIEIRP